MNEENNEIENFEGENDVIIDDCEVVNCEAEKNENDMGEQQEKLNPWITIWTKPRKTMRYIINDNPEKYIKLLAVISGITKFLDKASFKNIGDKMPMFGILLLAVFVGSISGLILLYINAALLKWTGKWIGGKGSIEHIRAAVAWGSIPFIMVSIIWIPELILFGKEMFTTSMPNMESSLFLITIFLVFGVIEFIVVVWDFFIMCKCLGEVQGFSAWKGFANYLLVGLILIVTIILVLAMGYLLIGIAYYMG